MTEIQNYLKETAKMEVMTHERETMIGEMIQSNELTINEKKALHDEIINGNLRFVITIAKKYQGQGLPLMDLINEGNIGMIKALELFDWTRGLRFITYAVWWIKQSILQALNEDTRTIRLPANIINDKIKRWKSSTSDEFATDEDEFVQTHTISYDVEYGETGDLLINSFADSSVSAPDSIFEGDSMMMSKVKDALMFLTDREREIIGLLFGLGGDAHTIDGVAEQYDLSRERIRQIKEKAIRKMRSICS